MKETADILSAQLSEEEKKAKDMLDQKIKLEQEKETLDENAAAKAEQRKKNR